MGYTVSTQAVPLMFRNPALDGLEVWMGRPSIEAIGDMMLLGGIDSNKMTDEDAKRLVRVFKAFGECLIRWNVDVDVLNDNGIPTGEKRAVPATPEGVRTLDGNFTLLVILGWVETVTGLSWTTSDIADIPMKTNKAE